VTDIGLLTVRVFTVPLVNVALRKSNAVGFNVIVKALAATDAEIN
jgi:hypothetical protein